MVGAHARGSWRRQRRQPHVTVAALLLPLMLGVVLAGCAAGAGGGSAATATATPTTQQRLAMLAQHAIGALALRVTAAYDAGAQTAQVTATVGWGADIASSQANVKAICLRAQDVLWSSGIALRKVSVLVRGPVIDDFGDTTTDTYGVADLSAATAAHLGWNTLSPDGAWAAYDSVYLRPAYRPNQMYGTP